MHAHTHTHKPKNAHAHARAQSLVNAGCAPTWWAPCFVFIAFHTVAMAAILLARTHKRREVIAYFGRLIDDGLNGEMCRASLTIILGYNLALT